MPYHLCGGVLAGSIAAIVTAPIDAIKTRMQVMQAYVSTAAAAQGESKQRRLAIAITHERIGQVYGPGSGIVGTCAAMLRRDGVAAFTRLPRPATVCLAAS
jgi:hypothetical protein